MNRESVSCRTNGLNICITGVPKKGGGGKRRDRKKHLKIMVKIFPKSNERCRSTMQETKVPQVQKTFKQVHQHT